MSSIRLRYLKYPSLKSNAGLRFGASLNNCNADHLVECWLKYLAFINFLILSFEFGLCCQELGVGILDEILGFFF